MEWNLLLLFLFAVMLVFLAPGFWISAALGLTGLIGLAVSGREQLIASVSDICWNTSNDFILTAVPLFLFMGEVIVSSGISGRFYQSVAKWLSRVPGGLLHSNIIACAIFAAISGSSVATAAGIGSIAIPTMKKHGYKREAIYGSLASGGTLGILIPPSISLILYGAMTDQSIVQLFTAAIAPGILLTLLFLIYTGISAFKDRPSQQSADSREMTYLSSLSGIVPMLVLIALTMGSLYSGRATPTEAAGIGAFLSILVGYIFGHLNMQRIYQALVNAVKTTSMIVFIMLGAQIFSFAVVSSGINRSLIQWIVEADFSKWVLFLMVCLIYLVLGCFMDGNSMVFLTIPLLYPLMVNTGFDPIWFGVVMVVLIEVGLITPPLGLNLFVIQGIDGECSVTDVVRGSIPYMLIMFLMIIILAVFPGLVFWNKLF